ncbi:hypothetical protein E2C01_057464 [Portunus trituberculatus]|uniref:Uncharacterized protein n=1 Tax=Portunus trituberculatus TaxID=210409 RepID=A0A5B7H0J7_PORTR|nr:hypothetical protein [Portunus trituberculatus]
MMWPALADTADTVQELPIQRPDSGVIPGHLYHQDQSFSCVRSTNTSVCALLKFTFIGGYYN